MKAPNTISTALKEYVAGAGGQSPPTHVADMSWHSGADPLTWDASSARHSKPEPLSKCGLEAGTWDNRSSPDSRSQWACSSRSTRAYSSPDSSTVVGLLESPFKVVVVGPFKAAYSSSNSRQFE